MSDLDQTQPTESITVGIRRTGSGAIAMAGRYRGGALAAVLLAALVTAAISGGVAWWAVRVLCASAQ
jgi:hypothetical protein